MKEFTEIVNYSSKKRLRIKNASRDEFVLERPGGDLTLEVVGRDEYYFIGPVPICQHRVEKVVFSNNTELDTLQPDVAYIFDTDVAEALLVLGYPAEQIFVLGRCRLTRHGFAYEVEPVSICTTDNAVMMGTSLSSRIAQNVANGGALLDSPLQHIKEVQEEMQEKVEQAAEESGEALATESARILMEAVRRGNPHANPLLQHFAG